MFHTSSNCFDRTQLQKVYQINILFKKKLYSVFSKMGNYEERGWFLQVSISHEWIKINKKNLENSFKYNKLHFYYSLLTGIILYYLKLFTTILKTSAYCTSIPFQGEKFWLLIIKMFKYTRPNFFLFGTLNLSRKLIYNPVKLLWLGFLWKKAVIHQAKIL